MHFTMHCSHKSNDVIMLKVCVNSIPRSFTLQCKGLFALKECFHIYHLKYLNRVSVSNDLDRVSVSNDIDHVSVSNDLDHVSVSNDLDHVSVNNDLDPVSVSNDLDKQLNYIQDVDALLPNTESVSNNTKVDVPMVTKSPQFHVTVLYSLFNTSWTLAPLWILNIGYQFYKLIPLLKKCIH